MLMGERISVNRKAKLILLPPHSFPSCPSYFLECLWRSEILGGVICWENCTSHPRIAMNLKEVWNALNSIKVKHINLNVRLKYCPDQRWCHISRWHCQLMRWARDPHLLQTYIYVSSIGVISNLIKFCPSRCWPGSVAQQHNSLKKCFKWKPKT